MNEKLKSNMKFLPRDKDVDFSAISFFNHLAYEFVEEGVAEVRAYCDFVGLDEDIVVVE